MLVISRIHFVCQGEKELPILLNDNTTHGSLIWQYPSSCLGEKAFQ